MSFIKKGFIDALMAAKGYFLSDHAMYCIGASLGCLFIVVIVIVFILALVSLIPSEGEK